MHMCWINADNAIIWLVINIGIKIIMANLSLYIGQYEDATHDGLVKSHEASLRHA